MLNMEKLKNQLYAKTKTNLIIDANKELTKNAKVKSRLNASRSKSPKGSPTKGKPNITKSLGSTEMKNALNKSASSSRIIQSEGDNDYTVALPRGKTLRASTPYQSETKKKYDEYRKQKEKWILKKGFNANFGQSHAIIKGEIPNYVINSNPKVPIEKFKYREVKKEKWIDKKGLVVRNSADLIY